MYNLVVSIPSLSSLSHRIGNIQTFVRQLHFYGFRKFENAKNEFCFSHPHFRRDQPHLIFAIKRKTRGETVDTVVTNGELRGIGTQINQLDTSIQGIKRDMARVFERLGFQADVGLGSYDVTKKRKMASAGSELVAVTEKQAVEQMRHTILIDKSEKFTYKKESAREQAKQTTTSNDKDAKPTPVANTADSVTVTAIPTPTSAPTPAPVPAPAPTPIPVVKAEVSLEPEPAYRGGDINTVEKKREDIGVAVPPR